LTREPQIIEKMSGTGKIFLFVFIIAVCSCAYDNAEELYGVGTCPPDGVSFSQTISPIINSSCAVSGCHVTGRQLPTLETYEQISSNAARIKERTSNGTMPPASSGITLSQEQIDAIACWVEAGAPNN
jgi:hypothetical protein